MSVIGCAGRSYGKGEAMNLHILQTKHTVELEKENIRIVFIYEILSRTEIRGVV